MTPIEFITIIFGTLAGFWLIAWVGELVASTPKIFYFGKFKKFLRK